MSHTPQAPLPGQERPLSSPVATDGTDVSIEAKQQQRLASLAQTVLAAKQSGQLNAEAGILPRNGSIAPPLAYPAEESTDIRDDGMASATCVQQGLDTMNFLRMAVARNFSDIHFRLGCPPIIRKDGDMTFTKLPVLTQEALDQFIHAVVPEHFYDKLKNNYDFDFNFEVAGLARFRVNWFYEMGQPGLVIRIIKTRIPDLDTLGLPPLMEEFTQLHKGIVLITGPTGSGKTTTLASMLNRINQTQSKHIITLEDPIEYVYSNDKSVITQRQLGIDTENFHKGLKHALRQDPDVILVGEMRDRETIMAALHAAETGHMVFSTLHTVGAVQTIYRIINAFEPHEREQIRRQIAMVLQGTVAQRLVKRKDGKGRLAIAEVLRINPAIRDYIDRGEIDEIHGFLNTTSNTDGSVGLNIALQKAVNEGQITEEEALLTTESPSELSQLLRGFYKGA